MENIFDLMKQKMKPKPFFATNNMVKTIITDMDHHPYTRWYRGRYYLDNPVIMDREAGFRKINNSCYQLIIPKEKEIDPEHCWEFPCTTISRCVPKFSRYSDQEVIQSYINRNMPIQYI